jgi:hypothetical protein
MKCLRLASETLLPKGFFENAPRMPGTISACADQRRFRSCVSHIIIDAYLDDCSTGKCRYSEAPPYHSGLTMTDTFDDYLIDRLLSESKSPARSYDELTEAGMAKRFVNGTSETRTDAPAGGRLRRA